MKFGKWNTRHCPEDIDYLSPRYGKRVFVAKGTPSDGATDAGPVSVPDINSRGWWVHDELCKNGVWYDGSKCTNWQASRVLSDILAEEGFWFRARSWFVGTWLFGGGKARDNGMF